MKAEGRDGRARECPKDGLRMVDGQGSMAGGRSESLKAVPEDKWRWPEFYCLTSGLGRRKT